MGNLQLARRGCENWGKGRWNLTSALVNLELQTVIVHQLISAELSKSIKDSKNECENILVSYRTVSSLRNVRELLS